MTCVRYAIIQQTVPTQLGLQRTSLIIISDYGSDRRQNAEILLNVLYTQYRSAVSAAVCTNRRFRYRCAKVVTVSSCCLSRASRRSHISGPSAGVLIHLVFCFFARVEMMLDEVLRRLMKYVRNRLNRWPFALVCHKEGFDD